MARRVVLGLVLLLAVAPAHAARLLGTITFDNGPTVSATFRFSTKQGACGSGCGYFFGGRFRCRGAACGGRWGGYDFNIYGGGWFGTPFTGEQCYFAYPGVNEVVPFYHLDCARQPIRHRFTCQAFDGNTPRFASGTIDLTWARCLRQKPSSQPAHGSRE
jgi:hypothetical protein